MNMTKSLALILSAGLAAGAAGCRSGNVGNKLLGGVAVDAGDAGGGGGNFSSGTVAVSKDETIESATSLTDMVQQFASTGGSFAAPAPGGMRSIRVRGVVHQFAPGDVSYNASTGFYSMDTGQAGFTLRLRFQNAAGAALDVINNPSLDTQIKSIRIVAALTDTGESINIDMTYTLTTAGDPESGMSISGTISGTDTIALVNSGGGTAPTTISVTFTNLSADYNEGDDSVTMNGSMALTATYTGGGMRQTVTLTNLLVHSTGFSSGAIAFTGETGGVTYSGTITFAGGTGTGTITFSNGESITVNLNADGSGTYTDSTGTHPIEAV
jgi:hypothetical protein